MPEYQLYCFAQSGNCYRAALMLNLIGADWKPVFVDFFKGETRTPAYRGEIKLHSYEAPDGPLQYGYYRPARAKRAGSKSKRKG